MWVLKHAGSLVSPTRFIKKYSTKPINLFSLKIKTWKLKRELKLGLNLYLNQMLLD